jgi:hypothetical protein
VIATLKPLGSALSASLHEFNVQPILLEYLKLLKLMAAVRHISRFKVTPTHYSCYFLNYRVSS